jgi:hypothetical protein
MYENAPQETRYIYTDFDSSGKQLNGAHGYTVTFPAGQTPPVDGFWSLTLYNKEHLNVTPANGVTWLYRAATNGSVSGSRTSGLVAPYWVRVVRSGSTFTGYFHWTG